MKKLEITVQSKDKLLNIVSQKIEGISFSYANKLLRQKDIRVDGKKVSENIMVFPDSKITVFVPDEKLETNQKNLNIVYQDDKIIVVFKPKGIEVAGEGLNLNDMLIKQLNNKNIFALNRLDRNTEGLVLFANGKENYNLIKKGMNNGEISKIYLAEVVGKPNFDEMKAVHFLLKDEEKSEVKIFDKPVKDSVKIESNIKVLNRSTGGTSVLEIEIKNGKTHQIRAQLAHIGYPIVGDGKYGKNQDNKKFKTKTQKLTAVKVCFNFKNAEIKYLNNLNLEVKPTWLNF